MNEKFKKQLYLKTASSITIFLTIILIIYENVKKKPRMLSLIALSIAFILMSAVQITLYKDSKKKTNLILGIVYLVVGIVNLGVLIF